jgi:hypothetical protein
MRCATAGKLVSERRGRPGARLHPALEAELAQHLAGCPDCVADAEFEASLATLLAAVPAAPARTVDVRARVLVALVSEPAVDRRIVSPRQLFAGAVVAGGVIAALGLAAAWLGPALADRVGDGGLVAQLGRALAQGARALRGLGVAGVETLRALASATIEALGAVPALRRAWSLAFAALGHLALASMLLLSAWWIGRDILRPARRTAREENFR